MQLDQLMSYIFKKHSGSLMCVHAKAAVEMAMVVTAAATVRFGTDIFGVDKEDW